MDSNSPEARLRRAVKYMQSGTPGLLRGMKIHDSFTVLELDKIVISSHNVFCGMNLSTLNVLTEEEFFQLLLVENITIDYSCYLVCVAASKEIRKRCNRDF